MKIGVLGTGMVGVRLADALVAHGHDVKMGGRTAESAAAWNADRAGTFAEAAAHGDVLVLAVRGDAALDAVRAAGGAGALAGKVLMDVTNPLDFSEGFPPKLIEGLQNTASLGEALQAELPDTHVVKSLNTMSNFVMTEPGLLDGPSDTFLAGNDAGAKATVAGILHQFGWEAPIDLGGIEASRGLEAWLLLWTRAMGPMGGNGLFNLRLVRARDGN